MMLKKLRKHIRLWNAWRQNTQNSWRCQLLVLLGGTTPTFETIKACEDRPYDLGDPDKLFTDYLNREVDNKPHYIISLDTSRVASATGYIYLRPREAEDIKDKKQNQED